MPATDLQQPRTPLQRTAPRRAKSQQRVAELLAAARAVFSEHGFQRATTAQIAEKAGVSEATVFTYFAGKRELCIQVISDWYDEISGDLEAQVPRLQGVRAKLAYVIRQHLVTLLADGSGMCALVLGEARATAPELAEVITDCKRRYTAPLMEALAQARDEGRIRQDMPLRLMRDLVYGSMEHVLWDSITAQRRPSIDETAEQLTTLVWSALVLPAALPSITQDRAGTAPAAASDPPLDAAQAHAQFRDEVAAAMARLNQHLASF
ncbi:MAG: TetR/AcrR family transcriptional regulator [Aquabacterium sp.]|jgi:AcrR family transcriptional regulator|uniref:TetR/AcrR family transcriptional regulator n=1 Tax=Aquabacterium sp. TaxID=1872578 RepID=UPI003BAF3C8C